VHQGSEKADGEGIRFRAAAELGRDGAELALEPTAELRGAAVRALRGDVVERSEELHAEEPEQRRVLAAEAGVRACETAEPGRRVGGLRERLFRHLAEARAPLADDGVVELVGPFEVV